MGIRVYTSAEVRELTIARSEGEREQRERERQRREAEPTVHAREVKFDRPTAYHETPLQNPKPPAKRALDLG